MSSKVFYLAGSDKSVQTKENRFGKTPIYPSVFFQKKEKPLVLLKDTKLSQEELKGVVVKRLKDATLTSDVFLTWLYGSSFGESIKLESDWTSFGVVIGSADEKISFRNIFKMERGGSHNLNAADGDLELAKKCTDLGVAMVGLATFRLSGQSAVQQLHRQNVAARINDLLSSETGGHLSVVANRGLSNQWMVDKNFLKVVAAVDMFYYRFPTSEEAKCRVSIMGCRYRDCSAYVALGYMCKITGLSEAELLSWVWLEKIGHQIVAILKSGEECEDEYSYFPYQSCFCLTSCSAYSVTQNQELYLWIQATGCLLLNNRSLNAIKSGDVNPYDVAKLSTLLGYACSKSFCFKEVFTEKKDGTPDPSMVLVKQLGSQPTSKNGKAWLKFFLQRGKLLPDDVKIWLKECQEKFPATRAGSVGEMMANLVL
ncbi:nucleoprotein [Sripur virus]|uniref:Nucleoprotein n=1 Tax=Sripur virus TaxID=1620897 RepID=A0A0D3R1S3_9RHAB|nr:nucleoprotein [Sripur virus]AJR28583.1 nucleoprotein [Sripur virus]